MTYLFDDIVPYVGTDTFKLGDNLESIRKVLKQNKVPFNQSVDPNKGCEPEIPWTFIEIDDSITLCFVKDVLFEIVFENRFEGKLNNGVRIGTDMSEVKRVDDTLEYNDDDEDFISRQGYWIVDDIDTGKVNTITVFLPEVDEPNFFKYEWVEKYLKRSKGERS